jgi:outer membrane protein assembly factor BamA
MIPLGLAFVNESTIFREYGPVAGRTYRLSYDASPPLGDSWLARQTVDADMRQYLRIGSNGVFATRFKGFKSWGRNPDFSQFGGNSEMRGYEYLEFVGNKGFFLNAELRFPLIEAMLTPIGVLGGLRGAFFANVGGAGFNSTPFQFMSTKGSTVQPLAGYDIVGDQLIPRAGDPVSISGPRLIDGRASYGFGLQSFLLGFPMHFDFSWRTLFNKDYEDSIFRSCFQTSQTNVDCVANGDAFRKMRFDFWIGYDF